MSREIFNGCELLQPKTPETLSSDVLADKDVIGLYFSASWCGPCKHFTPLLSRYYAHTQQRGDSFEVVFISLDRSSDTFGNYYDHMPWKAVPFDESSLRKDLTDTFGVSSIPCLVFIDSTGQVLTTKGVELLSAGKDIMAGRFSPAPKTSAFDSLPVV